MASDADDGPVREGTGWACRLCSAVYASYVAADNCCSWD